MFTPTARWMRLMLLWLLLAVVAAFFRAIVPLWAYVGAGLLVVCLVDVFLLVITAKPKVRRNVPGRFALGENVRYRIEIDGVSVLISELRVVDGIPEEAKSDDFPITFKTQKNQAYRCVAGIVMMQRGVLRFGSVYLRITGHLGCFSRKIVIAAAEEVKVYPNYAPVLRLSLLAMQNRQEQMGVVKKSRSGSSKDFHQLREYRRGDSLAQIDWKATSRRYELISRDYQEQMNQHVVFLLDCGRRMRALHLGVSHFDHCLNALLFVAYTVLKQGDHLAVQSFGGSDRWLPPVKGPHSINTVMNHLYDAETTGDPSDFKEAAERLMMRVKRRALVIVLTNIRSEDDSEIMPALRLIKSRHLLLLANLSESVVQEALVNPVENFSSALKHLAAQQNISERKEVFLRMKAEGIQSIDTIAEDLPVALANRYLTIKGSGRL